ncbi:MAG: hypothetical protein R2880_16770 [Deinococcales bacterium]
MRLGLFLCLLATLNLGLGQGAKEHQWLEGVWVSGQVAQGEWSIIVSLYASFAEVGHVMGVIDYQTSHPCRTELVRVGTLGDNIVLQEKAPELDHTCVGGSYIMMHYLPQQDLLVWDQYFPDGRYNTSFTLVRQRLPPINSLPLGNVGLLPNHRTPWGDGFRNH